MGPRCISAIIVYKQEVHAVEETVQLKRQFSCYVAVMLLRMHGYNEHDTELRETEVWVHNLSKHWHIPYYSTWYLATGLFTAQSGIDDSHNSSTIHHIILFQDDDKLWQCGGRLQNADLSPSTIHPILLDKGHHLTVLFIRQAHEKVMHSGVKATLTELRSRFWVVKGRCSVCRRYEGQPYRAPPPPPLPSFRVEEAPPFAITGRLCWSSVREEWPQQREGMGLPVHLLCGESGPSRPST